MQRELLRGREQLRILPWLLFALSTGWHVLRTAQVGLVTSDSDLETYMGIKSMASTMYGHRINNSNLEKEKTHQISTFSSLHSSTNTECSDGFVFVKDIQHHSEITVELSNTIPKRIFQTSKSKCVVPKVQDAVQKWQFEGWDYFLFDDGQVEQFFVEHSRDFPMLQHVSKNCLPTGTLKADLWRYLVLWEYGGVYADIDAIPSKLTPEMMLDKDGLFVVEQYHLLSQYFIAVSPRHPLMWYAVQSALRKVIRNSDLLRINAAFATGPHALHEALYIFADRDGAHKIVFPWKTGTTPVATGTYVGTNGRSIVAIGTAANQNEYVNRDVLRGQKGTVYEKMGMTHFAEEAKRAPARRTCIDAIFNLTHAKPP